MARMTLVEIKARPSMIDWTRVNATVDGDIAALAGVLVAGTGQAGPAVRTLLRVL